MAPIETLNDEEQQYKDIRLLSSQDLQKLASLDTQKKGIIARHEIEARMFKNNKRIAKWNTFLTIIMLVLVSYQTQVASKQIELYQKELTAGPDLQLILHGMSLEKNNVSSELWIENSGTRASDGAYLKIGIDPRIQFLLDGAIQEPKVKQNGIALYELPTNSKIIIRHNVILGRALFILPSLSEEYSFQYSIAADKMKDKIGSFIINKQDSIDHKRINFSSIANLSADTASTVHGR